MRLRDFMSTRVVTIDPTESASVAWSRMRQHGIRHLVVTDTGRLAGVISDRDLGGERGGELRNGRTVQDLMTQRVVSVESNMTLRQAVNLMRGRLIGSLPVVDHDRLVGIVTATDVLDELGRGFASPTVGAKPAPLQALLPRRRQAGKREGSTETTQLPMHIRATHGDLASIDRDHIRRKLGTKLGKFASFIERISVRTEDVNGPRGGVDQICRIKVVLRGLPSVVFESRDASLNAAVDLALSGVERSVRRTLQRRRMKPLRRVA